MNKKNRSSGEGGSFCCMIAAEKVQEPVKIAKPSRLPKPCRKLAGNFPTFGNLVATLQDTFQRLETLSQTCRRLSNTWKPCRKLAGNFPIHLTGCRRVAWGFPNVFYLRMCVHFILFNPDGARSPVRVNIIFSLYHAMKSRGSGADTSGICK